VDNLVHGRLAGLFRPGRELGWMAMPFNLFTPTHLVIILLVIVVLFGAKKLPSAARGIGQSLRIFKAEMGAKDGKAEDTAPPAPQQQLNPAPQPPSAQQHNTTQQGNVQS
jgi:sec-independent protein translocase protein TatA